MKFIHTADLHFGAEPDAGKRYSPKRKQEIWNTFSRLIDVCNQKGIDLLLIAGDVFHRQPLLRELKEFNYLCSKLQRTKVVLIAGNHDYVKWDSYYRTFQWCDNVFPLLGEKLECVEFPALHTCVYGKSYYKREIREEEYREAKPFRQAQHQILLAHGGDEKHIPFSKNDMMSLGYDYIALGHIHRPAMLVENRMAYAGALEPIDRNDTGKHGYLYGEMKGNAVFTKFVPFASREYVHLELPVEESMTNFQVKELLQAAIQERGVQHMYQVRLTGFRDAETIFDTTTMDDYGNVLEVEDATKPAYQFERMQEENRDNLLGNYIARFASCAKESVEYQALYEGVEALLETKRG